MSYMNKEELFQIGFLSYGEDVKVSSKASIYGASRIALGDHVRIDDYCVLSAGDGGIRIGSYVHIAVYTSLIGAGRITLENFANVSSRVSIYSSNDDYSGEYMTNPTVPESLTNVDHAPVVLGEHVIVGAGSIILPGVSVGVGCAIGALSLVKEDLDPFGVYIGNPVIRRTERKRNFLALESSLLVIPPKNHWQNM